MRAHLFMDLRGKIALVTGGTRGIGAATAVALAREGAAIVLAARRLDDAALKTSKAVSAMGRRCELIRADFSQAAEAARCVREAQAKLGPIDVLVHAAGGPVNGGLFDLTPEAWHEAFAVHVH